MSGNFDKLLTVEKLRPVADAAIATENTYQIDYGACCLLCRRAAEFATR